MSSALIGRDLCIWTMSDCALLIYDIILSYQITRLPVSAAQSNNSYSAEASLHVLISYQPSHRDNLKLDAQVMQMQCRPKCYAGAGIPVWEGAMQWRT